MPAEKSESEIMLEWKSHPLCNDPKKGILGSVSVAFFVWLFHYVYSEWYITIIALIFLLGSLRRFFLPTHFIFSETDIIIQGVIFSHRRAWNGFRRADIFENGALLSTFDEPSRLDAYRGMNLYFHGNKDQVVKILTTKIGAVRYSALKRLADVDNPQK